MGIESDNILFRKQQVTPPRRWYKNALCLSRLDWHEAHGRPCYRLADRLGIGRVVLVALDVSLHVGRRHQPHRMPNRAEITGPVVRCRARFHADKAGLELTEQFQQLIAADLAPQHGSAVLIDAGNLKDVLRDIQTDGANLHGDGSSPRVVRLTAPPWHSAMPSGSGAVHPIKLPTRGGAF